MDFSRCHRGDVTQILFSSMAFGNQCVAATLNASTPNSRQLSRVFTGRIIVAAFGSPSTGLTPAEESVNALISQYRSRSLNDIWQASLSHVATTITPLSMIVDSIGP